MSLTRKALWIVERHLDRELSLQEIAAACGVSPFHLAHAFSHVTGRSLMAYVRGRRLTGAAKRLSAGEPDILSLALAVGYGSHEAFTRAFRGQFGVTPESVRAASTTAHLALVEPFPFPAIEGVPTMKPRFVDAPPVCAVGIQAAHSFENVAGIPAQWQAFRSGMERIANRLPAMPLSIWWRHPDDEGRFEYVCAVEVAGPGPVPEGMVRIELPATRYAVFEHREHVSLLPATYAKIYDEWLPAVGCMATDAPGIERHAPAFDPRTGDGGVDLWIPVTKLA